MPAQQPKSITKAGRSSTLAADGGLPLLRRPRPQPKQMVSEDFVGGQTQSNQILPADPQPPGGYGHGNSLEKGPSEPGRGEGTDQQQGPVQSGPFNEVIDLVGYSGDVEVRARYVPLGRKHAGPDPFPSRRIRHADRSTIPPAVQEDHSNHGDVDYTPQELTAKEAAILRRKRTEANNRGDMEAYLMYEQALHFYHHPQSRNIRHDLLQLSRSKLVEEAEEEEDKDAKPVLQTRYDKPVSSTQNYKRMPGWNGPIMFEDDRQTAVHSLLVQAYHEEVVPRVPQHQLKIEAAVRQLEELRVTGTGAQRSNPVTPGRNENSGGHVRTMTEHSSGSAVKPKMVSATKAVFRDGQGQQFCGQVRSRSPFADREKSNALSPSEAAVLQCSAKGGKHLNLKAYFISEHQLPPLDLVSSVTFVNLSFNCLQVVPRELYSLRRLQVLSLRNNPLRQLPDDINTLQTLKVLCVSYCLLSHLPASVCTMKLRDLDVSYNLLDELPEGLGSMKSLQTLLVAGNSLKAMPLSTDNLQLKDLRCKDNLFQPLFWLEGEGNSPQKLSVLSQLAARRCDIPYPRKDARITRGEVCHQCQLELLDDGLNLIRAPRARTHHVAKLPFAYKVCSTQCHAELAGILAKSYTSSQVAD